MKKTNLIKYAATNLGLAFLFGFLCILQSVQVHAQDGTDIDGKKVQWGVHAGLSINKVDIYYVQSGSAHALKLGNHSFSVPGFDLAVFADIRLGRSLRLRAMPGMTLFGGDWKPGNTAAFPYPASSRKVESVCLNLPVDVKFSPFRLGSFSPYLSGGLGYSFDASSLRTNSEKILRLNTSDLRCLLGLGLDYYASGLKIGVECKAGFDVFAPSTSAADRSDGYYFQNSPMLVIGINVGV